MTSQVLCTTSTLAVGMNLPAHLVVIKGTSRYCGSEMKGHAENLTLEGTQAEGAGAAGPYREYDRSVCLQVSQICWLCVQAGSKVLCSLYWHPVSGTQPCVQTLGCTALYLRSASKGLVSASRA